MKWQTESGRSIDIKLSSRELHRSKRQDGFKEQLKRIFPYHVVYEEVQIPLTRLSFDFIIPSLKVVVEVDSGLHDKYSPHFHGEYHNFQRSQGNDNAKDSLCKLNNFSMIRLNKNKYTDIELKELILT